MLQHIYVKQAQKQEKMTLEVEKVIFIENNICAK